MHILLTTDGSEGALAGARLVSRLASPDFSVRVLTVLGERSDETGEPALEAARAALGSGWREVRTEVRRGNPAEEILEAAVAEATDLIVVGSRGLGAVARFFLGSVAERVARHAPCPVLVAHPAEEAFRRVLVGFDGSPCSRYAAEWLRRLPLPADTVVRLVTVVPSAGDIARATRMVPLPLAEDAVTADHEIREEARERLQEAVVPFEQAGQGVEAHLRSGHGALGLLQEAEEWGADLIVVGTHGTSGIERFLLGSVSEYLLRHAPCSVLVVRGR